MLDSYALPPPSAPGDGAILSPSFLNVTSPLPVDPASLWSRSSAYTALEPSRTGGRAAGSSNKRRAPPSTEDEDVEGDMTSKKKGRRAQPARPPNSWICYRSDKVQVLKSTADFACLSQADLSKLLGQMWRNESPEVREYYTHLAAEKKAAHREKYPDYVYRPARNAVDKSCKSRATSKSAAASSSSSSSLVSRRQPLPAPTLSLPPAHLPYLPSHSPSFSTSDLPTPPASSYAALPSLPPTPSFSYNAHPPPSTFPLPFPRPLPTPTPFQVYEAPLCFDLKTHWATYLSLPIHSPPSSPFVNTSSSSAAAAFPFPPQCASSASSSSAAAASFENAYPPSSFQHTLPYIAYASPYPTPLIGDYEAGSVEASRAEVTTTTVRCGLPPSPGLQSPAVPAAEYYELQ